MDEDAREENQGKPAQNLTTTEDDGEPIVHFGVAVTRIVNITRRTLSEAQSALGRALPSVTNRKLAHCVYLRQSLDRIKFPSHGLRIAKTTHFEWVLTLDCINLMPLQGCNYHLSRQSLTCGRGDPRSRHGGLNLYGDQAREAIPWWDLRACPDSARTRGNGAKQEVASGHLRRPKKQSRGVQIVTSAFTTCNGNTAWPHAAPFPQTASIFGVKLNAQQERNRNEGEVLDIIAQLGTVE
ncbi:hypothetical protein B0H13DRAFT_2267028 [Mycena leptocephala]|nr:hypothetical protein B0H13DRAFT_2267028 [Mycena leptocephala]